MMIYRIVKTFFTVLSCVTLLHVHSARAQDSAVPLPREIIDLGALVTEDLRERTSGTGMVGRSERRMSFDFMRRENPDGSITGMSSFLTLHSHAGPHVDAPIHFGAGGGVDSIPAERFAGKLAVVDATRYEPGYTIPLGEFEGLDLGPDDIVFIYTAYEAPTGDDQPITTTLTREAAEYLADIPVRAFGTDGWGVESFVRTGNPENDSYSVHQILLSQGIPLYEQLFNLDSLLDKEDMYVVGAPLNIEGGDGMMVRPLVLVY